MAAAGAALEIGGANTLRGGKRSYDPRVLTGNYVEDRLEPKFEGTRPDARSTTRQMELEATHGRVKRFGVGLRDTSAKFDDTIDYGNVVEYDKKAGAETWKSVTRSTHERPTELAKVGKGGAGGDFSTAFTMTKNALTSDPDALDEYRGRWAREGGKAAERRFTSQFNRAVNPTVAKSHQVRVTRRLPGVPKPVEDFRDKITERGGMNGIRSIARIFRIIDDSGDKRLSRVEFKNCLADYGLAFTETEFFSLFRYFDRDGNDYIDYDEFLRGVRGEMNERRRAIVDQAFAVVDKTGDGVVTVADLALAYDTSQHPDVQSGKLTREECLADFLGQWESGKGGSVRDGKVTPDEFADYYTDISSSVFDDDEFELIIRNAWHIAGGEGAAENTANLRVLATLEDGSMRVVCVNDDLGLDKEDEAEIIRRLAKQGVVATDVSLNL
mmetsp:Transcript_7279/g.26045  ORF Transcript_7279/g.26045 Transcript_7279/m.26045 type:complete len:441 (-) Transcript_7279:177-1499(-)|eukprot:CAMPEP_0203817080 /NCGR_PEP_ID=MMETSP0115-20131106/18310_1 /ASSEMBLY_ACC=CAM_ASM_000227 /TAXON_ID=33651 /ORGANISM="Bicosoecid sp, Strain ms1" /LENGTH=440 /DNA_ID=CAMNT_0050725997 /DNA_START=130 /DNA_END=1452 /DNA_ORIENTATION=+